jgi:hypothetical protein
MRCAHARTVGRLPQLMMPHTHISDVAGSSLTGTQLVMVLFPQHLSSDGLPGHSV